MMCPTVVLFVVLFVMVDILSKYYKLRERNREINIQVLVEEHYERHLNQEEQFLRENPQYRDTLNSVSSSDDTSWHHVIEYSIIEWKILINRASLAL